MKYKDTYSLRYQDFYLDDFPIAFRPKGDNVHVIAGGMKSYEEADTAFFKKVAEFLEENPGSTVTGFNKYIGKYTYSLEYNAVVKYRDEQGYFTKCRIFYVEEDYEEE